MGIHVRRGCVRPGWGLGGFVCTRRLRGRGRGGRSQSYTLYKAKKDYYYAGKGSREETHHLSTKLARERLCGSSILRGADLFDARRCRVDILLALAQTRIVVDEAAEGVRWVCDAGCGTVWIEHKELVRYQTCDGDQTNAPGKLCLA